MIYQALTTLQYDALGSVDLLRFSPVLKTRERLGRHARPRAPTDLRAPCAHLRSLCQGSTTLS